MIVKVSLTEEEATHLHMERGALFTWDPDTRTLLRIIRTEKK